MQKCSRLFRRSKVLVDELTSLQVDKLLVESQQINNNRDRRWRLSLLFVIGSSE